MKKLINGIIEFRQKVQKSYIESFGKLAVGQSPDTLFIACSDSRVVPNTFASTNPGDLFVLRNVGNMVPPCDEHGLSVSDESEAAAIEYATSTLNISHIVVCGHSECGAMRALVMNRNTLSSPNLRSWLRHGDSALSQFKQGIVLDPSISDHNQVSQLNVLLQMENIKSYPAVRERIEQGTLTVHGWWFDIAKADVYGFDDQKRRFIIIDEAYAAKVLKELTR